MGKTMELRGARHVGSGPKTGYATGRARRLLVCYWLLASIIVGCSAPQVGYPTYDLAKVLYRVCDQRSRAQLDEFSELLSAKVEAGEVTPQEQEVLAEIVATARAGDWTEAQRDVRALMAAQNQRNSGR